jgi:AcrR family transcriptional regulator
MERTDAIGSPLQSTRSGIRSSVDPRVLRTRAAILDAVERLVASSADDITVSSLVREAGIGRSSFYTHFSGIDELAVVVLRDAFEVIGAEDIALRLSSVSGAQAARTAQTRLVDHLAQHRTLYASMLSLPLTSRVYSEAVSGYAAQVHATIALLNEVPAGISTEAVAVYTASGSLGLLARWVLSDDPEPASEVVDQLMSLVPAWLAAP